MLLRTIAEEARGLENEQRFVLFVCMLCCMKCVELTLLSYLIARAFRVIRVICYIACHYIGVNRPTTWKECFWVESNGDTSANMSTVYWLTSEIRSRSRWSSLYLAWSHLNCLEGLQKTKQRVSKEEMVTSCQDDKDWSSSSVSTRTTRPWTIVMELKDGRIGWWRKCAAEQNVMLNAE